MAVNIKKDFGNTRQRKADLTTLVYGKVPPQACELEEAVLGACMLERDTFERVMGILQTEECFYVDAHQKVYGAMMKLHTEGVPVDLLTIQEELRKTNELELVGGGYFLSKLTQSVLTSAHVEAHARIVMEKFMQREVIRICGAAIGDAYEDSTDVFDLLDKVEKGIQEITEGIGGQAAATPVGETYMQVLRDIEEQKHRKSDLLGVDTGYQELNEVTLGWLPGDLVILAGRPSQGKTAFALNLAANAVTSTVSAAGMVLIYSLEASKKPLVARMAAAKTGVKLKKIRRGRTDAGDDMSLQGHIKHFNGLPIKIDDKSLKLQSIVAGIRREYRGYMKRETMKLVRGQIKVILPFHVIIDYLQLIEVPKMNTREQEVSHISRTFKLLAKELDINVLGLCQLNRNAENRPAQKPKLADLRESGAIEQDGQIIMFIWHEKTEGNGFNEGPKVVTWILVEKNKDGECKPVKLKFNGDIQRWMDEGDMNQGSAPSFVTNSFKKEDWDKADPDAPFG